MCVPINTKMTKGGVGARKMCICWRQQIEIHWSLTELIRLGPQGEPPPFGHRRDGHEKQIIVHVMNDLIDLIK